MLPLPPPPASPIPPSPLLQAQKQTNPLPPPPASPIPPSPLLQAQKQTKPHSLNQIIIPKYAQNQGLVPDAAANHESRKSEKQPMLRPPQARRTNPLIWCCAIYFNGDFALLANFSNPNRKIDVRFEYLQMELYFSDRLIATQSLDPFTQRPREGRLEAVHLVSSLVYLPENHAVALRTQVQNNRVDYNIRGTFRVRASLGLIHFSYWLHSRCQLQMTGPPTGVLVARSCRTKR
ncbi:putative Late embryogenesis abundant protein, LEA-14 [Rosa chinensis]|uniref:Putative Late embryogenesis abundant protein, LEA-14 n=1 Tax=Rosa chinensis TaxID=74649 RepID=A0A2P6QLF2_ROSCH|nr:putative Late embryogenesis abundant protein, LEA-14 [Rosa chinensis]